MLLRDRTLFNFELIERLLLLPAGVRVFTIVEACHAGIGSNLAVDKD